MYEVPSRCHGEDASPADHGRRAGRKMRVGVSVCSRLSGVAEQTSASMPARDPDRLIKWFIAVMVMGVGVNLLTSLVVAQKWAWLPPAVFVAALLLAVSSTGLLRPERYGTTRARAMALLALTGYLAVTVWGSVTGWPLSVMILSLAYLWEAGVMLMWSTLRSRADLDHVAVGTACLLVGSAFLLLGVANPLDAWKLGTVQGLVMVAFLALGVGALLLGITVLLDGWTLLGVPFLLLWIAAMSGGVAALLDGWTLARGHAAAGPGHGPAARGRVPAGPMDTAWVPVPAGRGRGPAKRCCGLAGRMDPGGGRVPAARSRVPAGCCRSLSGRMDTGGGPVPAARSRGPAGWYRSLSGRMDPGGGRVRAARDRGADGRYRTPVPP